MSTTATLPQRSLRIAPSGDLTEFADLPAWLIAIVQPERVRAALARAIPELAAGDLTLVACEIRRVRMKKDRWSGIYQLTVGHPNGEQQIVQIQGLLIPPGRPEPDDPIAGPGFGAHGWRCYVPELRLLLEPLPAETALPALPTLTDPEQARALLETAIRAAAQRYRDLQIQSCAPRVVRDKPGSRCTILYDLSYPADLDAARGWPELVVVKTYKGGKGKNAYAGMRALWESPLGASEVVAIAEPLAYLPELSALVQGPVREQQTLKDLIRSALRLGTPDALVELSDVMRKTAAGLAALHRSGAKGGDVSTWEDELAEVHEVVEQLGAVFPQLAATAAPLLARLAALAAEHPAEPPAPSHRSFRPAQVLLYNGTIGFIDFDSFGQAEPALDLALFLSATKNIGLSEPHEEESNEDDAALDPLARAALLDQLDVICDEFLAEYARHAPVSRQRVALWEALDLLTLVLTCWTKIKPVRLSNTLAMLERHLQASATLAG
ncbi:MAG TPA: phosphotransferase [Roseiflexaceae bacterium]